MGIPKKKSTQHGPTTTHKIIVQRASRGKAQFGSEDFSAEKPISTTNIGPVPLVKKEPMTEQRASKIGNIARLS